MGVTTEDIARMHAEQQRIEALAASEVRAIELQLVDEILERRKRRSEAPRPNLEGIETYKALSGVLHIASTTLAGRANPNGKIDTEWGTIVVEALGETKRWDGNKRRLWRFRWEDER